MICANMFLLQSINESNETNVSCRQTPQVARLLCKLCHCSSFSKQRTIYYVPDNRHITAEMKLLHFCLQTFCIISSITETMYATAAFGSKVVGGGGNAPHKNCITHASVNPHILHPRLISPRAMITTRLHKM